MSLAAEQFADRRRLRRKLGLWRIAAIVLGALAIAVLFYRVAGDRGAGTAEPHIARIDIEGVIGSDEKMLAMIETIAERESVKGVIVHIDSPGGTAVGGEAHYLALREVAEAKPVVAQVGTLAASAGYMIAAAADHIVARNTSIVGSIGVIVQVPNVSELLDRLGVDVRTIKSTPLKAEPSPLTPVNPEAEEMMRAMVLSSYEWFVALVAERREFAPNQVAAVADGSVFSGRQSLENGLVDAIGGEETAKAWLEGEGVAEDLPVIRYRPPSERGFVEGLLGRMGTAFGAGVLDGSGLSGAAERAVPLDGLVSLWHIYGE